MSSRSLEGIWPWCRVFNQTRTCLKAYRFQLMQHTITFPQKSRLVWRVELYIAHTSRKHQQKALIHSILCQTNISTSPNADRSLAKCRPPADCETQRCSNRFVNSCIFLIISLSHRWFSILQWRNNTFILTIATNYPHLTITTKSHCISTNKTRKPLLKKKQANQQSILG